MNTTNALHNLDVFVQDTAVSLVHNLPYMGYVIKYDSKHSFSINKNGVTLYDDICFMTSAMAIILGIKDSDRSYIKSLLAHERKFMKHYNNMLFYRNSENWNLYDQSKIDAVEALWDIKRLSSLKINKIDKY